MTIKKIFLMGLIAVSSGPKMVASYDLENVDEETKNLDEGSQKQEETKPDLVILEQFTDGQLLSPVADAEPNQDESANDAGELDDANLAEQDGPEKEDDSAAMLVEQKPKTADTKKRSRILRWISAGVIGAAALITSAVVIKNKCKKGQQVDDEELIEYDEQQLEKDLILSFDECFPCKESIFYCSSRDEAKKDVYISDPSILNGIFNKHRTRLGFKKTETKSCLDPVYWDQETSTDHESLIGAPPLITLQTTDDGKEIRKAKIGCDDFKKALILLNRIAKKENAQHAALLCINLRLSTNKNANDLAKEILGDQASANNTYSTKFIKEYNQLKGEYAEPEKFFLTPKMQYLIQDIDPDGDKVSIDLKRITDLYSDMLGIENIFSSANDTSYETEIKEIQSGSSMTFELKNRLDSELNNILMFLKNITFGDFNNAQEVYNEIIKNQALKNLLKEAFAKIPDVIGGELFKKLLSSISPELANDLNKEEEINIDPKERNWVVFKFKLNYNGTLNSDEI